MNDLGKIDIRDFRNAMEADKTILAGLRSPKEKESHTEAINKLSLAVGKTVNFITLYLTQIIRL